MPGGPKQCRICARQCAPVAQCGDCLVMGLREGSKTADILVHENFAARRLTSTLVHNSHGAFADAEIFIAGIC